VQAGVAGFPVNYTSVDGSIMLSQSNFPAFWASLYQPDLETAGQQPYTLLCGSTTGMLHTWLQLCSSQFSWTAPYTLSCLTYTTWLASQKLTDSQPCDVDNRAQSPLLCHPFDGCTQQGCTIVLPALRHQARCGVRASSIGWAFEQIPSVPCPLSRS
jgi:hypothetical protein